MAIFRARCSTALLTTAKTFIYRLYKNSSIEDVLKLRRITPRRQQFDIIPTQVVDSALTVNNNEDD